MGCATRLFMCSTRTDILILVGSPQTTYGSGAHCHNLIVHKQGMSPGVFSVIYTPGDISILGIARHDLHSVIYFRVSRGKLLRKAGGSNG